MPSINRAHALKTLGERLRLLREAQGKTIKEIAADADMPWRTLSRIEEGEIDFRILTLRKLCKGYGVTLAKLLDDFNSNQRPPP